MTESVLVRKVVESDLDSLLSLLSESSPGAGLTRSGLERDLTCGESPELVDAQQVLSETEDPTIELDLKLAKSNVPAARGYLATRGHNNEPLGVLLYHYHFSPWTGPVAAINHIYVQPGHRNQGIATRLLNELRASCKIEGVKKLLYETSKITPELMTRIAKYGTRVYRNDDTDWCVFRIDFDPPVGGR